MSRMLTVIHAGWATAKALARTGRRRDALDHLTRLLARPDLPGPVAADGHRLAAEILIDAEHYATARRHLRAAAALEPGHARTQYLLGLAYETDPHGDDRRAALRFREASRLEPQNAAYQAAFGRAAVRSNRVKTGVRELLAAAAAAPDKLSVLRVVVGGLVEAGRVMAARRVLIKARFLCPGSREVMGLWERLRFDTARAGQRRPAREQDARIARDGDFRLLPFVRVVGSGAGRQTVAGTIRRDAFSVQRPHIARMRSSRADG